MSRRPVNKNKRKLLLYTAAAVLLLILYFFGDRGYFSLKNIQHRADSLEVCADSLDRELEQTKSSIELLKKADDQTVESKARDLGMAESDEEMIIIKIDSSADTIR